MLTEAQVLGYRSRQFFSSDQENDVVALYLGGLGCERIAKRFNCSPQTVRLTVRRKGIKPHQLGDRSTCIHSLDVHAFDRPLSEEARYWLGMLMADGTVVKRVLSLGLMISDRPHVEKFQRFLQSTHPIYVVDKKDNTGRILRSRAAISVGSVALIKALSSLGIVPNKTYTATAPEELEFDRDFWRGIVDGDGMVKIYRNRIHLKLVGSLFICQQFLKYVKSLGLTKATVRPKGTIFSVQLCGSTSLPVIRDMYRHGAVSLDRKQRTANEILVRWPAYVISPGPIVN